MQVRIGGLLKVIGSFFESFAVSFEALGKVFEAIGDPSVSLEVLAILAILWWRGSYSQLVLAFTVIAVITLESGGNSLVEVPTVWELFTWVLSGR